MLPGSQEASPGGGLREEHTRGLCTWTFGTAGGQRTSPGKLVSVGQARAPSPPPAGSRGMRRDAALSLPGSLVHRQELWPGSQKPWVLALILLCGRDTT